MALPLTLTTTIIIILTALPSPTKSQKSPLLVACPDGGNLTANDPFTSDLAALLSNLTALAAATPPPFFATDVTKSSAHGLAQCRADVSSAVCSVCLANSAAAAAADPKCGNRTAVAVRYDYCVLRYSSVDFLGQLELDGRVLANVANASNDVAFDRSLEALMGELVGQGPVDEFRYAAGAVNYSKDATIYGLVDCTRDLSSGDCLNCLNSSMTRLFKGKVGGQVVSASCIVRFETYDFFNFSAIHQSLSSPSPSPSAGTVGPPVGASRERDGGKLGQSKNTTKTALAVAIPTASVLVLAFAIFLYSRKQKTTKKQLYNAVENNSRRESLVFDLKVLKLATNNFSDENKLGGGGFGYVYKGILKNGEEIAVKRLSRTSLQGFEELKNEAVLVAELQHRNLVKLLGYCLQKKEMLLVYEYLDNSSLDKLLFNPRRQVGLDWVRRHKIIEGIARGLLYLHEDSRLKIIHRDLKASNILLDKQMNPKISDFGLAKLLATDETNRNTNRIAGTYGYMAPEYALLGKFSTKSDVYSYGILIIEILTGKRNSGYQNSGDNVDLLSYAWRHWNKGTALQLIDRNLGDRYQPQQALRLLHIALLCVQEDPKDRPSMSSIIVMLSSFSVNLPDPLPPYLHFPTTTTPQF